MANSTITPLVKHVLSRELQLYFARLTEALAVNVGGGDDLREAALGSLRTDPGLHQLVPYLIGWGGDQVRSPIARALFFGIDERVQVTNHLDNLGVLQRILDLFHAILDNPTLFIEPYVSESCSSVLSLQGTYLSRSSNSCTNLLRRSSHAYSPQRYLPVHLLFLLRS
jgi:transcription initiation factor TFIID subunit 6